MTVQWLSLSDVAGLLGVHPSTVRNWSDQGALPVHRTQGGHRRYLRGEVDLWMQSQRADQPTDFSLVVQNAVRRTRFEIGEGHLADQAWYQKLDEEAREQYRLSGRGLMQGLVTFLQTDGKSASAEAEVLGYEYASRGRRYNLDSVDATHAFLFFRNMLMESMFAVYESAAVRSPYAWSDMLRKMTAFTDQILVTLLETYETYQRVSLR